MLQPQKNKASRQGLGNRLPGASFGERLKLEALTVSDSRTELEMQEEPSKEYTYFFTITGLQSYIYINKLSVPENIARPWTEACCTDTVRAKFLARAQITAWPSNRS